MNPSQDRYRRLDLLARLALTIAVGCGAGASIFVGSGTANAMVNIDRADSVLAELSQFIASRHASIRQGVLMAGSPVEDALLAFDAAVDGRVARLRNLSTLIEQQAGSYFSTEPLQPDLDVQQIEEQQRAYVTAAATIQATPIRDPARILRLFDLRAQMLIQTLDAVRGSVDTARARAISAAQGVVALWSGASGLLIAYLIWFPVFGTVRVPRLSP